MRVHILLGPNKAVIGRASRALLHPVLCRRPRRPPPAPTPRPRPPPRPRPCRCSQPLSILVWSPQGLGFLSSLAMVVRSFYHLSPSLCGPHTHGESSARNAAPVAPQQNKRIPDSLLTPCFQGGMNDQPIVAIAIW